MVASPVVWPPGRAQTGDQTCADGVARRRKDDRDGAGRRLQCLHGWSARRDDDVHVEPCELARDFGESLGSSLHPAVLNRDGASLEPAKLAQSLHEGIDPFARSRARIGYRESDRRRLAALLRPRYERPRHRADERG